MNGPKSFILKKRIHPPGGAGAGRGPGGDTPWLPVDGHPHDLFTVRSLARELRDQVEDGSVQYAVFSVAGRMCEDPDGNLIDMA
ncbi:MAG TPA: hypothetical protein VJV23_15960 [Candidatus Polarisedimenticolia bacterium]|nr:hypothetical protein [Candidatus Polarisedimenticolia bacterium]